MLVNINLIVDNLVLYNQDIEKVYRDQLLMK